jgi:hypothetical protein
MRRLVTLRLPAFRFLHFMRLIGQNRNNGRRKGRPHPCPFLGPNRFRASRDRILLTRAPFPIARRKNSGVHSASKTSVNALAMRRENVCHEISGLRPVIRHPEVRAQRASKGDGPGASAASFEGRSAATSG